LYENAHALFSGVNFSHVDSISGTAVDFTEKYLLAFDEELKGAKDPDSLINAM